MVSTAMLQTSKQHGPGGGWEGWAKEPRREVEQAPAAGVSLAVRQWAQIVGATVVMREV